MHDAACIAAAVKIMQHQFQIGDFHDPVRPHLEVDEEEIPFPFKEGVPSFGQIHGLQKVLVIIVV